MAIFVEIIESRRNDEWKLWFDEHYDMVTAIRADMIVPTSTLQGAYNMLVDFDAKGVISSFETVTTSEVTYWKVDPALKAPKAVNGQLTVTKDVDDGQEQAYFTNPEYSLFYARFGQPVEPNKVRHIAIGEQIIVDVTKAGMIAGVWMLELPPEIGEKHASKRKTQNS